MMTFERVKKEVKKMDPKSDGEGFMVACVLLSALETGPYVSKLEKFTGYEITFLNKVYRRMKKAGVWKDGKTHCQ